MRAGLACSWNLFQIIWPGHVFPICPAMWGEVTTWKLWMLNLWAMSPAFWKRRKEGRKSGKMKMWLLSHMWSSLLPHLPAPGCTVSLAPVQHCPKRDANCCPDVLHKEKIRKTFKRRAGLNLVPLSKDFASSQVLIKKQWALLALLLFHGDDSPHLPEVLKAGTLQDRTRNFGLSTIWPFWRFEVLCLLTSVWVLHLMKNLHALEKRHQLEQKCSLFLTVCM